LRVQDAAAWARLIVDAETVDRTGEYYGAEDLAEELADPLLDLERATLAGWDGDILVGVGILTLGTSVDPVHRMFLNGVVRPAYRRRGVGRHIVEWALAATPVLSEERWPGAPMELRVDVDDKNTGKAALFAAHGFAHQRWFFGMSQSLDRELAPPRVPAGFAIEPYDADRHDEQARLVRNEAFEDHWRAAPVSAERWRQWFTRSRVFRPDLTFVAVPDGGTELAAFLLSQYYAADTEASGKPEVWISMIATRRAYRKRGLARALIDTTLIRARELGLVQASLGVDADSLTGAVGLYEAAGFAVHKRTSRYARSL
jgi:mycothiol synthase